MHADFDAARAAIDAATTGMTADQLLRHAPGKWSSAQVLEHLAKAYGSTAYILDKCVREHRTVATPPSPRQRFFTWVIVGVGYFPQGRPAPAVTVPEGLEPLEALEAARTSLAALDAAAARGVEVFGLATRVANHPILGGFTIPQWRRFHRVHTRHHMKQIVALRSVARQA